jgi:hypothetical protein
MFFHPNVAALRNEHNSLRERNAYITAYIGERNVSTIGYLISVSVEKLHKQFQNVQA